MVRELEVGSAVYARPRDSGKAEGCRESLQCQAVPCCVAGSQRWLAFHADVHVEWFGSGEPMVGASRRRGFFIAELEYPDTTEGLELGKLLKPLV